MNFYGSPEWGNVFVCVVLALANAAVAFTIAKATIFEPFRNWIKERSVWLGKLFHCPYCVGHWLTFGAVIIYRPVLVELFWPVDLLVTAFAMIMVMMYFVGLIGRAFKSL